MVYLRTRHQKAVGLDEFLALGLVALAFSVAQLAHASAFLSVFAAGLALQRVKERSRTQAAPDEGPAGLQDKEAHLAVATHPNLAGAYLMQAVRGFNEQIERIAELIIILAVGAMLPFVSLDRWTLAVPRPAVFCPASVVGMAGTFGCIGIWRSTPADRLVWHSRHRFDLLPDVCTE